MSRPRIIRRAAAAAALAAVLFAAGEAAAQPYPAANKITLIVAFAPGGIADTVARLVAQGLSERLHQSVVVENRGGAGGNIAASFVARAEPDGYTLLATTTALSINQTLFANKDFSASDFKTVAIAAISPEALATSASNPANNFSEFLKAMAGKTINFAVPGIGTASHIQAEYFFKFLAKVPAQMIPFQGGAPAINATIGDQVDILATTLGGGAAAQMAGGKLKGMAIADDKRAAVAPNVPTYVELGYPRLAAASWVGFFAPAKVDPQIVATLNGAIDDIVRSPQVQKKLADMGFDPIIGSPAAAEALFNGEVAKWGAMVKALDLSIK
jgi:tripartite-type tricarboxylate transporter receptor subunit TctC